MKEKKNVISASTMLNMKIQLVEGLETAAIWFFFNKLCTEILRYNRAKALVHTVLQLKYLQSLW